LAKTLGRLRGGVKTILVSLLLLGCSDAERSTRILENDGYADIKTDGYWPLQCSDSDTFSTAFVAKKNGRLIKGTVCCGFVKNCTIRVE